MAMLLIGLVIWAVLQQPPEPWPEPTYQSGTLTDWLRQYDQAARALTSTAPSTEAALERMQQEGRPAGEIERFKLGRKTWVEHTTARRDEAAAAVKQIGTNALPALMAMLRYEDPPRTRWSDFLLTRTPLLSWMSGAQKDRYLPANGLAANKHSLAIQGFQLLGPSAKPVLREALNGQNLRVRQLTERTLQRMDETETEGKKSPQEDHLPR